MIRLCSCGFATDDDAWFTGHLFDYPAHNERTLDRYLRLAIADRSWNPVAP
jgi:hypothetical protein